ncbi:hypothetical protein [Alienimonas sp. DA493]|uniref:hypothetical protein n=1 Tax=Alienimonas sp. DA493 TaxID=3373605 RepID=UPI00375525B6
MKAEQFLSHHGVADNPFSQEDAGSDHLFLARPAATRHPAWDKIAGDPANPSTAVVFGEKGSGKTALRHQLAASLADYNLKQAAGSGEGGGKTFVIHYDDFNPFLDSFRDRLPGRHKKPEKALAKWRTVDHMDAVLALGVGRLVRSVFEAGGAREEAGPPVLMGDVERLERRHKRDLLLLAALYDHSLDEAPEPRWERLRAKLGFPVLLNQWDFWLGVAGTILVLLIAFSYGSIREIGSWWYWAALPILLLWLPVTVRQFGLWNAARKASASVKALDRRPGPLRKILSRFSRRDLAGQPLPIGDLTDARYELLVKFQNVLKRLGFSGVQVLVDRVDEPHLINGSPERMKEFLWPLFDNKFLKHPGLGFKLLLPAEVRHFLNREDRGFYERSRLDKQNMVPSLEWTGESLYDIAEDRLRACAKEGKKISLTDLFDENVHRDELVRQFARLRVPRHLFKFLYRLIVEHCGRYPAESPKWTIGRETLDSTFQLFLRDLDAFDRGMGTG